MVLHSMHGNDYIVKLKAQSYYRELKDLGQIKNDLLFFYKRRGPSAKWLANGEVVLGLKSFTI